MQTVTSCHDVRVRMTAFLIRQSQNDLTSVTSRSLIIFFFVADLSDSVEVSHGFKVLIFNFLSTYLDFLLLFLLFGFRGYQKT